MDSPASTRIASGAHVSHFLQPPNCQSQQQPPRVYPGSAGQNSPPELVTSYPPNFIPDQDTTKPTIPLLRQRRTLGENKNDTRWTKGSNETANNSREDAGEFDDLVLGGQMQLHSPQMFVLDLAEKDKFECEAAASISPLVTK